MPKITRWTHNGGKLMIKTPKKTGESNAAWQTRHDDAVTAAKLRWPED